jgi:hypothetical protein
MGFAGFPKKQIKLPGWLDAATGGKYHKKITGEYNDC